MLCSKNELSYDKNTLFLDVGGTFIKCSDGREISIDSNGSGEDISMSFSLAVGEFCERAVKSPGENWQIAVAIPGPFDYSNGIFRMKHKFCAVYDEPFRKIAAIPEFVKLVFAHDVNSMLAGEMAYSDAKSYSRVALITLGTGLGFSMCIDGEILKTSMGSPLHAIYNIPYKDGILEDYASKRGFMSIYESKSGEIVTVKEIANRAFSGEKAAKETFESVAGTIADALMPIMQKFDIECILFGGQISKSFALMEPVLKSAFSNQKNIKQITTISDFENATFNGLKSLLSEQA